MTTAQLHYRDYLIELEPDAQGWRAMAITRSVKGATMLPPRLYHPDRVRRRLRARRQRCGRSTRSIGSELARRVTPLGPK